MVPINKSCIFFEKYLKSIAFSAVKLQITKKNIRTYGFASAIYIILAVDGQHYLKIKHKMKVEIAYFVVV